MIEVFKFEDETEEQCRLKCLDELDVYNNEILTKEYEEDGKYKMEVVKKEDVKEYIKSYLEKVTTEMGLETKFEINEDEEVFSVKMFSNNNPILIGKDGRTLNSLQLILRQIFSDLSKINLNMTIKPIQTGLPLRIFDIMGCGGFCMTNYQAELPEYFEIGVDLEAYSSMEELVDKCSYYLTHEDERRQIALNGYEKVKQYHGYVNRMVEIIKKVV